MTELVRKSPNPQGKASLLYVSEIIQWRTALSRVMFRTRIHHWRTAL
jgi:hypothetical protein